jgi:RND family efflux transporter MFP subunit
MKKLVRIILLVVLVIAGCNSQQNKTENVATVPVKVMEVKLGTVVQSLTYNGDIKAEFEVKVFSKIPDRIEKFYVDDGDAVAKGAKIAQIYAETIEQAVMQAEASLTAARAQEANLKLEYERAQKLYKESAMSKQQYDGVSTQYEAVQAQVKQVEAGLATAKSRLADALITAPISGIIGKRYYEDGDMAAPQLPVVSIVQMNRVKIAFNATETDLGKLKIGQKASIAVKSYPDTRFEGQVSKISPVLDPLTRMAEIELLIDNRDSRLKPGMYARVDVITGTIENTIVVPREAVIESTSLEQINGEEQTVKNYYVFVVDSAKAQQRKLKVNYVNHRCMAVDSGVAIGEKLVISGHNNLREDNLVTIVNPEGGAK